MSLENFLSRLHKVRRTSARGGEESYTASCPCHKDNHPSLAITQKPDGVILLHCFSQGCSPSEVTAAVGLELGDLFPPRPDTHPQQGQRRGGLMFNAFDVLRMLSYQLLIALAFLRSVQRGETPSDSDIQQFGEIVCSLSNALDAIKPTLRGTKQ